MSISVNSQRIRLALDSSKWFQSATDIITNASPQLSNGADLQFELAFSYGELLADAQLVDLSTWASVTVSLKKSGDRSGLALWSQTTGTFDAGMAYADWAVGTAQHVALTVSSSDNQVFLTSNTETFWLVVEALTTDVPAKLFPVAAFPVTVTEVGIGTTPPAALDPATYYTRAEADARYFLQAQDVHLASGKTIYDGLGNKILDVRQAAVADYVAAGGWSDATAYSDFTGLKNKLNAALAALRAHGLIAP